MEEREAAKQHIEEMRRKLAELEKRAENLRDAIDAYENVWGIKAEKEPAQASKSRNGPSNRSLYLRVVREAGGKALHAGEIWERAKVLGADSKAKRPDGAVDLTLRGYLKEGKPIENLGRRRWRWIEEPEYAAASQQKAGNYDPQTPDTELSNSALFLRIVKEAAPQKLRAKEIWKRAEARGATSSAKRTDNVVDRSLRRYRKEGLPLKRTRPAIWRWTGDLNGSE